MTLNHDQNYSLLISLNSKNIFQPKTFKYYKCLENTKCCFHFAKQSLCNYQYFPKKAPNLKKESYQKGKTLIPVKHRHHLFDMIGIFIGERLAMVSSSHVNKNIVLFFMFQF